LALLDGEPRSAAVQCVTDCLLYVLEQEAFLETLEAHPRVLTGVVRTLTSGIRDRVEDNFRREQMLRVVRTETEIARHRALAQMVAGVAHELNTPLGVAVTAGTMIASRTARPEVAAALDAERSTRAVREDIVEATELLQRNLERAHKLVESFKKIAVNQLTDALEQVDLPETVEEIVHLFAINARQAHLRVAVRNDLPDDVDHHWTGYVGYLTQVLMNLLTNIERYAYPDGQGGPVEVVISRGSLGTQPAYVIAVTDFGVGIEPAHLGQVFEPFFTTGRFKGGTGLGMAIVHNLVTVALKGTIHIDSAVNQGTTVRVSLPSVIREDSAQPAIAQQAQGERP
jgi:signal transduction histidine kinase